MYVIKSFEKEHFVGFYSPGGSWYWLYVSENLYWSISFVRYLNGGDMFGLVPADFSAHGKFYDKREPLPF